MLGLIEKGGLDIDGQRNNWVDSVGPENDGCICKVGHCRTGQWRTKFESRLYMCSIGTKALLDFVYIACGPI